MKSSLTKISQTKISLTIKLVFGVALILALSLAVLERKTSGILLRDKILSLKNQSSQISYSLAISVGEKVKRLDRHLRLILTHAALNTPLESRPSGEDMLLVGVLQRAAAKPWEANWIIKGPEHLDKFSQDFTTEIQTNIQLDKVRSDEHSFARLVALDGQPMFVMMIRISKPTDVVERIAVGVLSASAFFDLVAPYKGSLTTAFLVDQSGIAYAHPNLSMTGSALKNNPVVDRITNKFSAAEQMEYEDSTDSIVASFDSIPRTNLVAVSTMSVTKATALLGELKWSFVVLGLGLLMLAMIFATYISYLLKSPLSKFRRAVDDLASGKRSYVEAQSSEPEMSELATSLFELDKKLRLKDVEIEAETHEKIYQEKMSAFSRLSTGLVNELRNPMIGILGHTQLAREKIRDPESIRRHLDLIERDVRKTKDLIEDISQFAGAEKLELDSVNIYEAVTTAVEQAGRKVHTQNISILKNLESVSSVTANAVLLRKALLNMLTSTANLVSGEGPREIIARLESENEFAKITFIFQSAVIGSEDQGKIFDPFTITEGQVDLGLDLALAKGILEAHDAEVVLEQTGETHYQFVVRIPKIRELPETMVTSPFTENPGLELKGLSFALPEFSLGEGETGDNTKIEEKKTEEKAEDTKQPVMNRQLMSKVPLENMKIKIRKPTLRV